MTLSENYSFPLSSGTKLEDIEVERFVLEMVPADFARQHRLLPFGLGENALHVLTSEPVDVEALDTLACLSGLHVVSTVTGIMDIGAVIERCYGAVDPAPAIQVSPASNQDPVEAESPAWQTEAHADASDAPVIALVHGLIRQAISRRASDIHIEPLESRLRVRYRIDGALVEADNPPRRLQSAIISRIKIMSDISIAEKRVPQDGRMPFSFAGRSLDLRVSVVPAIHGESVVMRILDKENLKLGLQELGFSAPDEKAFGRLLGLPDGIVLVTGPTGSGKTTTLYSCLQFLNGPGRKIITVEDPVEYQLPGINQVPVRKDIGMTFAAALRAMLRQAPNVVMVGEIRDGATAEIALQASLTGHLVFSTLHTNDAVGAITRLVDLGAKPFLIAASLRAVLAQRLVRKNCPACSVPWQPSSQELNAAGFSRMNEPAANFLRGTGCSECDGTGYRGRMAICELLLIDDHLRTLIHAGASTAKLRAAARSTGSHSLREDGLRKSAAGLTTLDEILSITVNDAA